jgi:hypothetical protein
MNKITKVGVSALCGSLASVAAANAGTLAVTGGATATWSSLSGQVTGNPIGMNSALGLSGSGELDNGGTFTLSLNHTDQVAWSGAQISITLPGLGTIRIDNGTGTGLDRVDDLMPTAWEETWGTALGTGIQLVSGAGNNTDIEWALGEDLLPAGMNAYFSYSPKADGSGVTDKSVGGSANDSVGSGWDLVLRSTGGMAEGLDVWAGYSKIEQPDESAGSNHDGDRVQTALGATYAVGAVTVGYQLTKDNQNTSTISGTRYYDNEAYGISFAINDDLTISYGNHKSTRAVQGSTADVELEAKSLQLSYTMGAASVKIAETSADNSQYSNTGSTMDRDGTTVALSLAF